MSQLGRIGGQILTDNLLRAGVDLAFETDLLYLKVSPVTSGVSLNEDSDPNFGKAGSTSTPFTAIGINTDVPIYDFDVNSNIHTDDLTVVTQLAPGNLRLNAPNTITTSVGGIDVYINGGGEIFHDRLVTDNLVLDGNLISSFSNSNIVLDPNGASGTVELIANTNITGNLAVSGNIGISGNLSSQGTLTFGDNQTFDTVTINTDFTQSIIPGDDLIYAMGADAGDSSVRRWSQTHAPDWTNITTGAWPGSGLRSQSVIVSDQLRLDGVINKISATQSNDDVILLPDTGIVYIESVKFGGPLTVNLTYTLDNPNAFGTSAGDDFGESVAVSGDYAIVGAYQENDASGTSSGKAYIYNVTTGALLHTLNNPNPLGTSDIDYFGWSVSISGNYAIVGAYREEPSNSGKVYIYNVTTGALLHTLNSPVSNVGFGYSVAASGDYAIVGTYVGADAYIYNVTTGALVHTLNNPNAFGTSVGDSFGSGVDKKSVAISDNYAIVGASREDDAGGTDSGKAYIFNVTTGALLQTLDNPNAFGTSASDSFGGRVAVSGDYAIVASNSTGVNAEDDAGGSGSGKAYIFNVTTGALLQTLDNPNAFGTSASDSFGGRVAVSGDYAIVASNSTGVNAEDDAGGSGSGKAYIFNVTTGALLQTLDNPNAFGTSASDSFGNDVAISGDYVIVGAPSEDDAGGTSSGKAYVYQIESDQSVITNLLNTPLTFASTAGIGYLRFMGDNGFVIPAGDNSQRRASPEVGETRWNTDEDYLECYDGTVWAVSTGGGIEVDVPIMEDLGHAYTLMLG